MLKEQGMVQIGADKIGEWVLDNLIEGRIIEFALDGLQSRGTAAYSNWWFMTWINFPQYDSMALYIDYCGGGETIAIPYYENEDFCERLQDYFTNNNDAYNEEDKINIEIKEG